MNINTIYNMECSEGLKKLIESNSIDLTVTSPPYEDIRRYKGFSWNFETVAKELYRVTKTGGVLVWVISDKTNKGSESGISFRQALYFMEIGFNLHDTMIYAKNNPIPLTHNRYEQQFEYMFVFSKGKLKTFNPIMEPIKYVGKDHKTGFRNKTMDETPINRQYTVTTNEQKIKNNIWFYNVGKNCSTKDNIAFEHPAIFPEALAKDHILSWSNEGDLVLDCFMGSGTVAKMCIETNRRYIGFEISEQYCKIAEQRISQIRLAI